MPRAERRKPARSAARWSPWWLAVPVLGIAAYAAFSGTLALLGEDPSRAPSGVAREAAPLPPSVTGQSAPPAVPVGVDGAAAPAPAVVPPPDSGAVADPEPTSASSVPSATPAATATAAVKRAAADGARKVKPKRAPHEHLTEQDHRALDAIIEQAGKKPR